MMADDNPDAGFGAAVGKGILYGLPIGTIGMILVIWLMSDLDLGGSVRAGVLPGVLFGVFAGGFVGVVAGAKH